jgi:membrane associated rhomboid family serine protease
MSLFRDFRTSARAHGAPATVGLVVALIAGFLAFWMRLAPADALGHFVFVTQEALLRPWTLLTYPYVTGSFIELLFACLWIWGIGGSVERELGSARYLVVWFAFTALCAFGLWLGATLLSVPGALAGAWTPVAALTIIWGTRNADAQMMLMFILPITGKWLAWLAAGLVFFSTTPPMLAPFAAAPLALAYFFAANRLPGFSYSGRPRQARGEVAAGTRRVYKQEYYDEVKRREQARKERERLRELFEKSVAEDEEKDG